MPEQPETPREEPPAACQNALVPGVIVCRNDDGTLRPYEHTPPHTAFGPHGARITWTDEESTTNG